jgi:hypothetical protein
MGGVRKSNRITSRAGGRGGLKGTIGTNVNAVDSVVSFVYDQVVDVIDEVSGEDGELVRVLEDGHCSMGNLSLQERGVLVEASMGRDAAAVVRDEILDFHSEGLEEDHLLGEDIEEIEAIEEIEETEKVQNVHTDWRGLFKSEKTMGKLEYFAPIYDGEQVIVSPPEEAIEEGIAQWNSSLVGQFLDKTCPCLLVKKYVQLMWKQIGDIEVFSIENGMFIFRLSDEAV